MRLTAELVEDAPVLVNGLKQRTLVLRNLGFIAVENLGACRDPHIECLDLSDNEVFRLDNFPMMPRVKTLIVANNKIAAIAPTLNEVMPNLVSLVLTNNRIASVEQLEPLRGCKHLQRLSLAGNPLVELDAHYVEKLAALVSSLKFVDGHKIARS